jgi:hypothetical protein
MVGSKNSISVFWFPASKTNSDELLLVFVIDRFKLGDFMTIGMNEKRAAWFCRVLDRVMHPAWLVRFKPVVSPSNNQRTSDGEDDEKSVD